MRMSVVSTMIVAGMLLALGAPPALAEANWPGWRGPNRDGKSPDTGLLREWPETGPRLLWQVKGIGGGYSTVAVVDGVVYTSGDIDGMLHVFAFDMEGKELWRIEQGPGYTVASNLPGSRSTPVIDQGRLYIESGVGRVGCYDAKTGQTIWTRDLREFGGRQPSWGYAESVLIHKNLAIVTPGGRTSVVALDKLTGKEVWRSNYSADAHYGSPLAVSYRGAELIVVGTGSGLACINPADGKLLWSNNFAAGNVANCPTPAFSDGYIFWANGYGKGGICVRASVNNGVWSFEQAWTTRDMDCHHGGYVIVDGYIYGNNRDGWTCLDLKTGKRMWNSRGVGKGSLCWADGMLFLFGENKGQVGLAVVSPESFELKSRFNVQGTGPSWAHPVVIGGRLYLRYDQNLYCFAVK
jgi:outer membrane protein assembly factor BamB